MDVAKLLERIRCRADYHDQIAHIETLPGRPGKFARPAEPLGEPLANLLAGCGVQQLYTHQVDCLEAARAGRDAVVVTGTASGKTWCYNLPILETTLTSTDAKALYLFPTKALAQDQLKNLLELVAQDSRIAAQIKPGVYDGDTPTAQRKRIRSEANLVLTNPDMLHASVLPYHPKWAALFSELRFVVLDEVHTYRGILGAHVSAVLRRLLRICHHYGSNPVFLAASATISNPGQLVQQLLGRAVEVIDNDGSPRGTKHFVLWNPAPLGKDSLARRSPGDDAVTWLTETIQAEGQGLVFTRTRQAAELVYRYAQQQLRDQHSPHAEKVRAYRGGYLPIERREMERALFSGELRGVAATNALELGIDIGSLDVAILAGYPGTIASCLQQSGRSGRRQSDSLAVLLAGNDAVDQYLLRNPQYFFAQSPEQAVVDPDNPYVLARHLKSAAFELPLTPEDLATFGPMAAPIAEVLSEEQQLTQVDSQYYCPGGQNPSVGVSLRHMSDNTFSIVLRHQEDRTRDTLTTGATQVQAQAHTVIANVDSISAPELVYPEAIYLHAGETYLVRELDLNGKVAYVERRETDYYTQAVLESNVRFTQPRAQSADLPGAEVGYVQADVSWQTVAFKKIRFGTKENIGLGPVDIPAQTLETTAIYLTPTSDVRAKLKSQGLRTSEGVAGLRNLALVALPMVAMCDARDLGGVVDSKNRGRSTAILYDRYPGGLGYAERGFQSVQSLVELCRDIVSTCPCEQGCPSCVGLPDFRPGFHSDPDLMRGAPMPNKQATLALVKALLNPAVPELAACAS